MPPIIEFDRPMQPGTAMLYFRALRDAVKRLDLCGAHVVSARVRKGRMLVQGSNGQEFDMWIQPCNCCPPGKRMLCPHWLAGVERVEADAQADDATQEIHGPTEAVPCPCAQPRDSGEPRDGEPGSGPAG